MADAAPLALLAEDAEDLQVISAALQDAVAKIGDLTYEPTARRLSIGFNRYRWEAGGKAGERVRCGLQLGGVMAVRSQRLRLGAKDAVIELLAIGFDPAEPPGGTVTFTFSGGGAIQVEVECVDAVLADVSAPWPASRRPAHET